MLLVEVEATSANVSVGFDVLGLSLNLTNKFYFEKANEFGFEGFEEEFSNINNNLVYDSYKYVFNTLNKELIPVTIKFEGDIPVSRGLGSSSSLIVAGVFAANYMLGNPLTKDEAFNICVTLEGHPDNVAPAVYGGLVASYKKDGIYYPIQYKVNDNLKFMVIIPPYKLSTHDARKVLPTSLEYKDIVNNLSRIVNIPYAFEKGDVNLLIDLFDDRLHEPYRSKLIANFDEYKSLANDNNCAFAISGSGSTMLIISNSYDVFDKYNKYDLTKHKLLIGNGVTLKEV